MVVLVHTRRLRRLRTVKNFLEIFKVMIKNVIAVHRLQCSALEVDSPVSMVNNIEFIKEHGDHLNIVVPAKLSINNKVVDKNMVWEFQLVFKTCEQLEVRGHWAYALDLADGTRLLIGSLNRPYPVTTSSHTLPDNLTDSQLMEITVTWVECTGMPVFA